MYIMKKLEVIPSPLLYPYYKQNGSTVIMVDAIRASATIITALHHGATRILPFDDIERTRSYSNHGYIISAERNADKVEGFDKGNSPFEFMDDTVKGKAIAMTTTNGTKAIRMAENYHELLIGGFVNFNALCTYLLEQENDVTVLCSGWKMRMNIEDNLFAGKLAEELIRSGLYEPASDSTTIARTLYHNSKADLYNSVMHYSPRLAGKQEMLGKDIRYCLQEQGINIIPRYRDECIQPV